MKSKLILLLFTFFQSLAFGQISNYNYFPSLSPSHILDTKLDSLNFALSFRILLSDYNGPLVRLRRASDNAQKDFFHADNDIVDIAAINTWRAGSNVYVVKWYDQGPLGYDAIQLTDNRQPRFYPSTTKPYFKGDGINDHLTVEVGLQSLTKNGVNGTVLSIVKASPKYQHTFGVLVGIDRWSTHINWSNNNLYFDPGICCNNPRYFYNLSGNNVWDIYTFIRTDTHVISRKGGVQKINGTHTTGPCTINNYFTIGWANGSQPVAHSTSSFLEFVMYKIDISATEYTNIEQNSILFWGL